MRHRARFAPITAEAVEELAQIVADAFAAYRAFAPAGWRAPERHAHADGLARWMGDPDFWGELARDGPELIGHATVIPARRHSFRPEPDPALAHLGHLFLKRRYWGSGIAAQLLAHAVAAASERCYTAMRLFVPVGQQRARGFYAREGFSERGEPFELGLGLPVLEYRRSWAGR